MNAEIHLGTGLLRQFNTHSRNPQSGLLRSCLDVINY